jgi:hypothetical protein
MQRRLEPEFLDELPANDPDAMRSRRDLRRVNWFMGNARFVTKALRDNINQPTRILEIGAGDGHFTVEVARRLGSHWNGRIEVTLLDRQSLFDPRTASTLSKLNWHPTSLCCDLFEWVRSESGEQWDVIFCNLFLHHFKDEQLRLLFGHVAMHTKLFAACEPWRNRFAPSATGLLRLLGCNYVTRHDAKISVRAGFREKEISTLWPADSNYALQEYRAGLFSHIFVAKLRSG